MFSTFLGPSQGCHTIYIQNNSQKQLKNSSPMFRNALVLFLWDKIIQICPTILIVCGNPEKDPKMILKFWRNFTNSVGYMTLCD